MLENNLTELFLLVHNNFFAHKARKFQQFLENQEITVFASGSIFAIPELYKTLLGHVGPGCEHEVGPTN